MINTRQTVEAGETPDQITISMIDQDLKDGVNKTEMSIKYGIKPWEVDEMFKHPLLKGRRPARKRTLSFSFVDDMSDLPLNSGDIAVEQAEEIDPNQVTLEQAIDEAIDTVTEVKHQMQETQEAINDMLSPTEYDSEELNTDDSGLELPSFKDTLDLVKEQQEEEELDMDDETFEL